MSKPIVAHGACRLLGGATNVSLAAYTESVATRYRPIRFKLIGSLISNKASFLIVINCHPFIDPFNYCASLSAPNSCLALTTTVSKYKHVSDFAILICLLEKYMLNVMQMLKHDYVQRKSRHKSNALDKIQPSLTYSPESAALAPRGPSSSTARGCFFLHFT